jgi:hypothetical protein
MVHTYSYSSGQAAGAGLRGGDRVAIGPGRAYVALHNKTVEGVLIRRGQGPGH